jgi:hypothetical protein
MRTRLVLAAGLAMLPAWPVHAERDPLSGAPRSPLERREIPSPINDRFYAQGGVFNPAASTTLRVDGSSPGGGLPRPLGTTASGEKDLGLDARLPQGRIELMFRLRKRNRLRVNYFETRRTGDRALTRPIQFGDLDFVSGDEVTSFLEWRSFDLTYTYSFIRTQHFELGTGIAASFLQAEARGVVVAKQERQEVSGAGAFPTIPLDLTWVLSRRLALVGRGQYFKVSLHGFTGMVGEYHGDLQFRWTRNFSLGLGYTRLKWALDVDQADFPGAFRLDVRGPEAFFKVSF